MEAPKRKVQWQSGSGQPVTAGGFTVTPQSRALVLRLPNGGLVWNRPVAVVVDGPDGTRRIPVPDITRIVQWSLLACSAACWVGFLFFRRRRSANAA